MVENMCAFVGIEICALGLCVTMAAAGAKAERKVPVTFSGGHGTDPRDYGRPVVLIAAALKVKPEVFRKAFSGVRPARGAGRRRKKRGGTKRP